MAKVENIKSLRHLCFVGSWSTLCLMKDIYFIPLPISNEPFLFPIRWKWVSGLKQTAAHKKNRFFLFASSSSNNIKASQTTQGLVEGLLANSPPHATAPSCGPGAPLDHRGEKTENDEQRKEIECTSQSSRLCKQRHLSGGQPSRGEVGRGSGERKEEGGE